MLTPLCLTAQHEIMASVERAAEQDNTFFKKDKYWRGADGAATVDLGNGRILWLFSDTFIDRKGNGKRGGSTMIRNSIAIQHGNTLDDSAMLYYYKGSTQKPESYFEIKGNTWFWTGHGIVVGTKLFIFLLEEIATKKDIGFEAIGWYVAIIDNPEDDPDAWNVTYKKGLDTFGVIVGSSAVLKDNAYVYAYGVKEPATHEVYLFRFEMTKLLQGDVDDFEWLVNNSWTRQVSKEPVESSLFIGQTEFSVHYDDALKKFVQVQTYGFGKASIGYRLADQLQGPWSEPVMVYTPTLNHPKEFVYTANAHPEVKSAGLVITYNINNQDFKELLNNEEIYFPKVITLSIK